MKIHISILNAMLDKEFNDEVAMEAYYQLNLVYTSGISEQKTISFKDAINGVVSLSSSVYFAIEASSGSTKKVVGIKVQNNSGARISIQHIFPALEQETFTTNGTFTVNDIIVSLTV